MAGYQRGIKAPQPGQQALDRQRGQIEIERRPGQHQQLAALPQGNLAPTRLGEPSRLAAEDGVDPPATHQSSLDSEILPSRAQAGNPLGVQTCRTDQLQCCRTRQNPGVVQGTRAAGNGLSQVTGADCQQQPCASQIQGPQIGELCQQGGPGGFQRLTRQRQQQLPLLQADLAQTAADLGRKGMGGIDHRHKRRPLPPGLLQLCRHGSGSDQRANLQFKRGAGLQGAIGATSGSADHRHPQRPAMLQQLGSQQRPLSGSGKHPQPGTLVQSRVVVQDGRHRGIERA